ncbi:hypothetical protein [Prosthecobacter sp.]|uniref:hypothetical protein n=1 Tax=Prosthecobacter sp. TaxID=1965333 RepID=UPI003784D5E6
MAKQPKSNSDGSVVETLQTTGIEIQQGAESGTAANTDTAPAEPVAPPPPPAKPIKPGVRTITLAQARAHHGIK